MIEGWRSISHWSEHRTERLGRSKLKPSSAYHCDPRRLWVRNQKFQFTTYFPYGDTVYITLPVSFPILDFIIQFTEISVYEIFSLQNFSLQKKQFTKFSVYKVSVYNIFSLQRFQFPKISVYKNFQFTKISVYKDFSLQEFSAYKNFSSQRFQFTKFQFITFSVYKDSSLQKFQFT